jgi:peroxiredoxin
MRAVVRRFAVLGVVVAVVGLLFWAGYNNMQSRRREMAEKRDSQVTLTRDAEQTMPGTDLHMKGKTAPEFKLKKVEGDGTVSLADYKGKPVIINFWGTWCVPCQLEMPWFQEFYGKYKDQGLTIVGISDDPEQPKEDILKTAHKLGVTYTLVYPDKNIYKAYGGVDVYPETFYVNKDGVVVAETAGAPSKDEMEANIRKALGEKL